MLFSGALLALSACQSPPTTTAPIAPPTPSPTQPPATPPTTAPPATPQPQPTPPAPTPPQTPPTSSQPGRTVIGSERGYYYGYVYGPNNPDPFSRTQWAQVGAVVTLRHIDIFKLMDPQAIKAIHGRLQHFSPADDMEGNAYFPYKALKALEAREIAAGRPPIFITATLDGKPRPVNFAYGSVPNEDPNQTDPLQAVNVGDERFIQFFFEEYLMKRVRVPGLENQWYSFDNCNFSYALYGAVDDAGIFRKNIRWDAPFPQNDDEWVAAIEKLLTALRAKGLKLICNGTEAGTPAKTERLAKLFDGLILEDFLTAYQRQQPFGAETLAVFFDGMQTYNRDKVQIFQPRTPSADSRDLARAQYLGYLIFTGPNGFFGALDEKSTELNPAFWADIKPALGAPVTAATFTTEPGATAERGSGFGKRVYSRRFERGIAYLNWTGALKTVTLPADRKFVNETGKPVTALTLEYTGAAFALYAP